jgi:hypothetical protein
MKFTRKPIAVTLVSSFAVGSIRSNTALGDGSAVTTVLKVQTNALIHKTGEA